MRVSEMVFFLLNHLCLAGCLGLVVTNLRNSRRSSLCRMVALAAVAATLCILGVLLHEYVLILGGENANLPLYLATAGIYMLPAAVLLLAIGLLRRGAALSPKCLLLFVPALIAFALLCTNRWHHLMFRPAPQGAYHTGIGTASLIYSVFSLVCLVAGLGVVVWFCIRHSGLFSSQALLGLLGTLALLGSCILFSFTSFPYSPGPIAAIIGIGVICLSGAVLSYDLPSQAAKTIVDLVRDGYLIVDKRHRIVEHNQAMLLLFPLSARSLKQMDMQAFWVQNATEAGYQDYLKMHRQAVGGRCTVSAEHTFGPAADARSFVVELTPLFQRRLLVGSAILLRDVTQSKRDVQTLQDTQAMMIERERLASLGQMVGGIAHNLKTPILSISGGVEALRELVKEYDDSIGDDSVTVQDHHEIAADMNNWLDKVRQHCMYISDMISAVKDQAVQLTPSTVESFTIDEFLKRLQLLMRFELKKYHCTLNTKLKLDAATPITGNVNALVQIFDNLIINALHAYDGQPGEIDLDIRTHGDKLRFSLTDYAKGIDPAIQHKLFREMVTTKGKGGTGLGLYLSYSTIVGHFNGQMEVDSRLGEGTRFVITIPGQRPPVQPA